MQSLGEDTMLETLGMKSSMIRCTILICAIAAVLCMAGERAFADIYQYTDDAGVVHFSNVSVPSKRHVRVRPEPKQIAYAKRTSSPRYARKRTVSSVNSPSTYTEIINNACDRHGVDPALVHAIVKVESDFNPYAMSRKGAMGLMQLMPQTAVNMNIRNIFSPDENIDGGVRYLRYLIDRYEGNLSLALAAYNSGETAVKKWGTVPPYPETQNYVQRILNLYNGTGGSIRESSLTPRYTIFIGYGEDGAVMLTDDPSKQKSKSVKRKTQKEL